MSDTNDHYTNHVLPYSREIDELRQRLAAFDLQAVDDRQTLNDQIITRMAAFDRRVADERKMLVDEFQTQANNLERDLSYQRERIVSELKSAINRLKLAEMELAAGHNNPPSVG